MKKIKFMLVVGLALAMALIFSCSKEEKELYCLDYIFQNQVCTNKIDGINVIDAKDCRNLGGKAEDEEISYNLGCSDKNINCLVGSTCYPGIQFSKCKAFGGTKVASCSGYNLHLICKYEDRCLISDISNCIRLGGTMVSSCPDYKYCISNNSSYNYCEYTKTCSSNETSVSASNCSNAP